MEHRLSVTLPLPPSENRRLILSRHSRRMILSQEARQYLNDIPIIIKNVLNKNGCKPLSEYVSVFFTFYFKDNRRRDTQNMYKILCDVLERAGLVTDDKYILVQTQKPMIIRDLPESKVIIEWLRIN